MAMGAWKIDADIAPKSQKCYCNAVYMQQDTFWALARRTQYLLALNSSFSHCSPPDVLRPLWNDHDETIVAMWCWTALSWHETIASLYSGDAVILPKIWNGCADGSNGIHSKNGVETCTTSKCLKYEYQCATNWIQETHIFLGRRPALAVVDFYPNAQNATNA